MSNEFDELIKNKVEEKEYAYTHNAWRKFCSKANIPFLSIGAKIAIAAGTLTVVAVGTFFFVNSLQNEPLDQQSNLVQPQVAVESQVLAVEPQDNETLQSDFTQAEPTSEPQPSAVSHHHAAIPSDSVQMSVAEPKDTIPAKPKPAVRQDKTQWKRVNVIDLDTVAPY